MNRHPSHGCALALMLLSTRVASALEEGEPHGLPLETLALLDTASVQEPLELQLSFIPMRLSHRAPGRESLEAGAALELGILDGVEIELASALTHSRDDGTSATGLGNTELGFAGALRSTPPFFLAAGAELELPAANARLGETSVGVSPYVLGDLALGELHAASMFGIELGREDGELERALLVGAGIYWDAGALVPVLEALGEIGADATLALAPGLFANLGPRWEVGLAGRFGLREGSTDYGALGIVTFEAELRAHDEAEQ